MFARLASNALPPDPGEASTSGSVDGAPHFLWANASSTSWLLAQRRLLGCPPLNIKPGSLDGHGRGASSVRARKAARCAATKGGRACTQALRRPPKLPAIAPAQHRPTPAATSAAHAEVCEEQLLAWLAAASTFEQLQRLCDAFLGLQGFGPRALALAIQRLPSVDATAADGRLLLMERLAEKLAPGVWSRLSASEIAHISWALAQVGYRCEPALLQHMLGSFFSKLRKQLAPQAVATLAVGLAGLGWRDADSWSRLRKAAALLLPHCSPRIIGQLVWALATSQQQDAAFCAAAAAACRERLSSLSSEEIANLVSSLVSLGCEEPALFREAARLLAARSQQQQRRRDCMGSGASMNWTVTTLEQYDAALAVMLLWKDLRAAEAATADVGLHVF